MSALADRTAHSPGGLHVVLTPSLPSAIVMIARQTLPEDAIITSVDLEQELSRRRRETLELLANTDVIIGFPWAMDDEAFAAASGHVRLIQLLSAGHNRLNVSLAHRHEIAIASNAGANARAVAEHTIMLMLIALRQIGRFTCRAGAGAWRGGFEDSLQIHELAGRRVGLIGMGFIAQQVVRLLGPFDVEVSYWSRHQVPRAEGKTDNLTFLPFDELLTEVDLLSLHVPLSSSTRLLIGARELELMRPSAVLVNTARGGLIDEVALARALAEGRLAGAALDTLTQEPPEPRNPLLAAERCFITPHMAGITLESWATRFASAATNIERIRRGLPAQGLLEGDD